MPNVGPPCPECKISSKFVGVQSSWFRNAWVEVYQCQQHGHRFEGPIVRNKKDKDYKKPPYEGDNTTA